MKNKKELPNFFFFRQGCFSVEKCLKVPHDIKFIVKVSFKLNNKSTVQTMKGLDMWGLDKKRDVYTI